MLFNFSFSLLKPLPLHQIFQTGNIKCTLIRRHMFLRVGSVCVESSPGLSLASTCDSLYSLYLFKQDRRFNAESLMDVGKLWKACADCHFFFFLAWHYFHAHGLAKVESSPLRNPSFPSSPRTIKGLVFAPPPNLFWVFQDL